MEKIEFKSLLILGGTGFIGHHIASYAIKLNWKVTSISLNSPSKTRNVKGVNYIQLNLVDTEDTNSFFWDEYDSLFITYTSLMISKFQISIGNRL